MSLKFTEVVQALEAKGIMPKTKPGLEKISGAVTQKSWFKNLDPKKIITVAGTNGKGTTCACLESLLIGAGKRVGLYTSPHLIQTTERIRVQRLDITEERFCDLYQENLAIIESEHLSHFESLTLMAADYFFSERFAQNLDYIIFEVGLGGTFDATNVFPNHYSVITALGLDHVDILGNTLVEVAQNKFGIIKSDNIVVHQKLASELNDLKNNVQDKTKSLWVEVKNPVSNLPLNLIGPRAQLNAMTALTLFEKMGFPPAKHLESLSEVRWSGRMQKVFLKKYDLEIYLSGDHNPQGVDSLLEIIRAMPLKTNHFILGIGKDKKTNDMLKKITAVPDAKIYLTETPFKGTAVADYPPEFRELSHCSNSNIEKIFSFLKEQNLGSNDRIIVTGSLYLVGQVLRDHDLKT